MAEGIVEIKDASHWYTPKGEPRYDATLSVAKKEGLLPGPSIVTKQAANPVLDRWKQEQLIMAALTLPQREGEPLDEFAKRVVEDAYTASDDAKDLGHRVHERVVQKILRPAVAWAETPQDLRQLVAPVFRWINRNVIGGVCEKVVVSREFGCAGTTDFRGMVRGTEGTVIIDWKTQGVKGYYKTMSKLERQGHVESYGPGKIMARWYESWPWQLAMYAMASWEEAGQAAWEGNPPRIISVVISTNKLYPGCAIRRWTVEEQNIGWLCFWHLLQFFRHANGFYYSSPSPDPDPEPDPDTTFLE